MFEGFRRRDTPNLTPVITTYTYYKGANAVVFNVVSLSNLGVLQM